MDSKEYSVKIWLGAGTLGTSGIGDFPVFAPGVKAWVGRWVG